MKALAVDRGAAADDLVGRVLCHDVRGEDGEIRLRKGHRLRAEDAAVLRAASWDELHLLELDDDDIGQRDAGRCLAESLASDALEVAPAGHRHVLRSKIDGLLRIDIAALQRMNRIPGIAVFTLRDSGAVAKGRVVTEAQITPLAVARASLDEAMAIARDHGSVVRVLPFVPRDAILLARDDRLVDSLTAKLQALRCAVREVVALPRTASAIAAAMEAHNAPLFFVTGSNALDPLDPVFGALDAIGATMQRSGLPVHPGTLLWIASWKSVTIIGLPSCGLARFTAIDLILPKLLAEGRVDDDDLAALGHGGIL